MYEPLPGLFARSKKLTLDFNNIPEGIEPDADMRRYFRDCEAKGMDPKTPQGRQNFNNNLLDVSGYRYLVGSYAEDRTSMLSGSAFIAEGRTLHLGIDIFAKELELVHAPCDGEIVMFGNEPEDHSFGHYLILRSDDSAIPFIFFGHLGPEALHKGRVSAGDVIGKLGDYKNHENGGWSRHLHLQMFRDLPQNSSDLIGYASRQNLTNASELFPDPKPFFPEWNIHP